jgi:hypothetical protein
VIRETIEHSIANNSLHMSYFLLEITWRLWKEIVISICTNVCIVFCFVKKISLECNFKKMRLAIWKSWIYLSLSYTLNEKMRKPRSGMKVYPMFFINHLNSNVTH